MPKKPAAAAPTELKPFKFVVQAVVLETDRTGKVISEHLAEPVTLYGPDELVLWAQQFEAKLADAVVTAAT